jgi:hypothetical protein
MMRLLPLLKTVLLAVPLYALLLLLGSISLAWNMVAMLLQPVLPVRLARPLGRATIALAYRAFWGTASLTGMMRIDADCLDALLAADAQSRKITELAIARQPAHV